MSYNTRITGSLDLDPPLPWSAIKDSPFLPGSGAFASKDPAIKFDITEWEETTDRGTLTVRVAVAIEAAYEDPFRAYSLMRDLEEALAALPEGTEVSGYLAGFGGDDFDFWRIYVRRNDVELARQTGQAFSALKIKADIRWPLAANSLGHDEIARSGRGDD
jgi:hypothetical protein